MVHLKQILKHCSYRVFIDVVYVIFDAVMQVILLDLCYFLSPLPTLQHWRPSLHPRPTNTVRWHSHCRWKH